jgi:hypothetical protein
MKYIRGFFAFWYDFIVGDAWEVAVGVVLALVVLAVALRMIGDPANIYGVVLLPLVVMLLLAFSLWRARPAS